MALQISVTHLIPASSSNRLLDQLLCLSSSVLLISPPVPTRLTPQSSHLLANPWETGYLSDLTFIWPILVLHATVSNNVSDNTLNWIAHLPHFPASCQTFHKILSTQPSLHISHLIIYHLVCLGLWLAPYYQSRFLILQFHHQVYGAPVAPAHRHVPLSMQSRKPDHRTSTLSTVFLTSINHFLELNCLLFQTPDFMRLTNACLDLTVFSNSLTLQISAYVENASVLIRRHFSFTMFQSKILMMFTFSLNTEELFQW